MPIELFYNIIFINSVVFEEDLCFKKEAYLTFPLKVNNAIIKEAINHFQVNIENTIKYMDNICYYYS